MVEKVSRIFVILFLIWAWPVQASGILATKHNLSSSGKYDIKSGLESRICVFCHTPHNAMESTTPLWNHDLSTDPYIMYSSRSINYDPESYSVPTGSSRLCLSCHDGTVAVGDFVGALDPILQGTNPDGTITSPTNLTTDLSDDHPISIPVVQTTELWAPEQKDPYTNSPVRLENGLVQCSSCHDAHNNNDNFLVMSPGYGELCQECHHQDGWKTSAHGDQEGPAGTIIWPIGSDKTVAQWACLGCHDMHGADEQELLQNDGDPTGSKLEEVCYRCHNGTAAPNIKDEFDPLINSENHPVQNPAYDGIHYPGEDITNATAHIECSDCHDPHHGKSGNRILGDDSAGGMLSGIWAPEVGPNSFGDKDPWEPPTYGAIHEINYEYELCLKCHGTVSSMEFSNDHMEEIDVYFNPKNEATHGCIVPGNNRKLNPQVVTGFNEELGWDVTTTIACSDCHGSDELPSDPKRIAGPHGSNYPWLLRLSGNPDPSGNDVVCYLCHDPMVYGKYSKGATPNITDQQRTNFKEHTKGGHWRSATQLPPGVPNVGCFGCHGDFSDPEIRPIGGYTPGGLHGANSGRKGRETTTTGVHFLNGFSIYIYEKSMPLLLQPGAPISCSDYDDGKFGCTQHSGEVTYTRR